jgi:hypothetical protein
MSEPDITFSADGDEPFAEMKTILDSVDFDRSRVVQIDVALNFSSEQPEEKAVATEVTDESTETSDVPTDPTKGIPVNDVGDGWLRAQDSGPTLDVTESQRHQILATVTGATDGGGAVTATDICNFLPDIPEASVSAALGWLYERGFVDRRRVHPDGLRGVLYEYRINSDGMIELDRLDEEAA